MPLLEETLRLSRTKGTVCNFHIIFSNNNCAHKYIIQPSQPTFTPSTTRHQPKARAESTPTHHRRCPTPMSPHPPSNAPPHTQSTGSHTKKIYRPTLHARGALSTPTKPNATPPAPRKPSHGRHDLGDKVGVQREGKEDKHKGQRRKRKRRRNGKNGDGKSDEMMVKKKRERKGRARATRET
ncbi:hypothetical protein BOTBODRAFT_356976 [Botryobasidium botryosum FD-172 SS1]|uniref:Uncharacterized protein n=1 Tax=Botryobasidium botryosum (strain FD-172 SS1) TaxID=930990 RepID=A0A067MEM5_BOTB1|nr:hypothetical protein BOTBODRAFT_356976 [Botryobasidium botryosum FD-172 SS1]